MWLYYSIFPTVLNKSSSCSKFLPAFDVSVLDFGQSCAAVFHCFNLQFPNNIECQTFFFFWLCTRMKKFPCQELSLCHSSNPSYSCDNARPLTHWASRELLDIFLYTYLPSICLLQWGFCSYHLPIYRLGCLFPYCFKHFFA